MFHIHMCIFVCYRVRNCLQIVHINFVCGCEFLILILLSDVLLALRNRLDAKWRQFGLFLGVDHLTMDAIEADRRKVNDCMLQLVNQWVTYLPRTGGHPRTWETVVKAVNDTGDGVLAQELVANTIS